MGQKVNPIGFRVGITTDWNSCWYAQNNYHKFLQEDIDIRAYVKKNLRHASISKVIIERTVANKTKVFIHSGKPGIILGKRAAGLDAIRADLQKLTSADVFINVMEVRKVETDATLVAQNIATQLEKRVSFRRAMKRSMQQARRAGAKGIKVMCAGRLGGAEMSRTEWYLDGRVPLHTLRANIDYGVAEAATTYGQIGVKVWIFKGEIHNNVEAPNQKRKA